MKIMNTYGIIDISYSLENTFNYRQQITQSKSFYNVPDSSITVASIGQNFSFHARR